jgi:hypothetical protein
MGEKTLRSFGICITIINIVVISTVDTRTLSADVPREIFLFSLRQNSGDKTVKL